MLPGSCSALNEERQEKALFIVQELERCTAKEVHNQMSESSCSCVRHAIAALVAQGKIRRISVGSQRYVYIPCKFKEDDLNIINLPWNPTGLEFLQAAA